MNDFGKEAICGESYHSCFNLSYGLENSKYLTHNKLCVADQHLNSKNSGLGLLYQHEINNSRKGSVHINKKNPLVCHLL